MLRPTSGTNVWHSIICGIALVVCVLSSPIGLPQVPNGRDDAASPPGDFARASDGPGAAPISATLDRAFTDAALCDFIEEVESSCSSSLLVSPAFITSEWPPQALSGLLPGHSSSMATVAVPLRC